MSKELIKKALMFKLCNIEGEKNLFKEAEKPGLWANIRAKRARGEKPAKPGDEDYPDKKQWNKLTKAAYSYSDEMGEMNRWLDGGAPWSDKLREDFYKDPKAVAALTKHFADIVKSQGADIKFLSDSYYDDKTIKMSPEEAINKLLTKKELKLGDNDVPNYYQIMYPFEQVGSFKWINDKHPSELSVDEYLKTLKTKTAASAAWQRSEGKNPEGGLNAKGRASYKRETGGTLKAPVTESNPKGERAKRQNSFCSRMCGMKRVNTGSEAKSNPDSRINKSLRKWNCKCGAEHNQVAEKIACIVKEANVKNFAAKAFRYGLPALGLGNYAYQQATRSPAPELEQYRSMRDKSVEGLDHVMNTMSPIMMLSGVGTAPQLTAELGNAAIQGANHIYRNRPVENPYFNPEANTGDPDMRSQEQLPRYQSEIYQNWNKAYRDQQRKGINSRQSQSTIHKNPADTTGDWQGDYLGGRQGTQLNTWRKGTMTDRIDINDPNSISLSMGGFNPETNKVNFQGIKPMPFEQSNPNNQPMPPTQNNQPTQPVQPTQNNQIDIKPDLTNSSSGSNNPKVAALKSLLKKANTDVYKLKNVTPVYNNAGGIVGANTHDTFLNKLACVVKFSENKINSLATNNPEYSEALATLKEPSPSELFRKSPSLYPPVPKVTSIGEDFKAIPGNILNYTKNMFNIK